MIRTIAAIFSVLSLGACLLTPALHFRGTMDQTLFRQAFAAASLVWFVAATTWAARRKA